MKRRYFLAIVAVSLAAVGTAPAATIFRITTDKVHRYQYDVKVLKAKAGQITISMLNQGRDPHNVAIRAGTAFSAKAALVTGKIVGKGGTSRVTVTLKKGKYRFFCSVDGHEFAGMWGILTVT